VGRRQRLVERGEVGLDLRQHGDVGDGWWAPILDPARRAVVGMQVADRADARTERARDGLARLRDRGAGCGRERPRAARRRRDGHRRGARRFAVGRRGTMRRLHGIHLSFLFGTAVSSVG
jgi:hypothetical protein